MDTLIIVLEDIGRGTTQASQAAVKV